MVFPHSTRASLALLGLAASPLQLIWIYSHLRCNAAAAQGNMFPAPEEWLRHYCVELLRHSQHHFHQHQPGPNNSFQISTSDGIPMLIVSPFATTAAHLLQANRILLGWNEAAQLQADGHRLAPHVRLQTGAYALLTSPGHPHRPLPPSLLYVSLRHHQDHHVLQVQGGHAFLFELLAELELAHIKFLVDLESRVYGADYRVWRPPCLAAIGPARIGSVLQGSGISAVADGLHDDHIWPPLQHLVASQSAAVIIHVKLPSR